MIEIPPMVRILPMEPPSGVQGAQRKKRGQPLTEDKTWRTLPNQSIPLADRCQVFPYSSSVRIEPHTVDPPITPFRSFGECPATGNSTRFRSWLMAPDLSYCIGHVSGLPAPSDFIVQPMIPSKRDHNRVAVISEPGFTGPFFCRFSMRLLYTGSHRRRTDPC